VGLSRSVAVWALALGFAMGATAQDRMQIQYAEALDISATPGNTQFDAYGRRFSLVLETNDRLLKGMPAARKAALSRIRLLRGTLAGVPNSWVRLTSDGFEVAGAIWDGADLYVIARHDQIASHLTSALAAAGSQTVVYRLSDTTHVLPDNFCATQPAKAGATPASGLAQFKGLIDELKLRFVAAPTDELDISLIADATLQQRYSSPGDSLTLAMLNTLNVVDGIYDAQLGLIINASELRMAPVDVDPFTSEDASTLLGQLKSFRSSIPEVQSKAVAHLFTGRVLTGGTLGIAVIGGACSAADAVSLTSVGYSVQSEAALIMAHEIGHNLGAEHDTAACGDTFLMWPAYSWSTTPTFSQCSLDQMRPFIVAHRGSCIVSPSWGDASPRVGAIANPLRTEPFVWPVYVRSEGTAPLLDAIVNIDIPGGVTINDATPSQGSCAPSSGYLHCEFGTIPAGGEARVDLNLTTGYIGPMELRAYANASNDRYDTNNQATGSIDVQPLARLVATLTPSTAAALVGQSVPYTITLTSNGVRDASNVRLSLGGTVLIESADTTQGTCSNVGCTLGDIPTGSVARVTVHAHAYQGGQQGVHASVETANALVDQNYLNARLDATATFDLAIDAAPAYRTLAAGVPYEFVIPVRANGTRPVVGGLFRMNTAGGTFLSADVDGTSCSREDLVAALGGGCPLGTLNPGEQKIVRVRLQFNDARDTSVYLTADILNDELWINNSASVTLNVRVVTDVSVSTTFGGVGNTERQNFQAVATLHSQGANDAANVSATFDVPVGVRVLSATLPQGVCTLTGDRRVTCTRPALSLNEEPQMTVTLVGDEPAQYTGTFAVTADNDGVPSNNSAPLTIYVGPSTDVTLNPIPALPGFIVGQPREFTVEVVTNLTRPAENVVVTFPSSLPQSLVLEAISTPVGTCDINASQPRCNLGTLPPNSLVRLTPRYRAVAAGSGSSAWVTVQANRDVDQNNNSQHVDMRTYDAGDVELRLASANTAGTAGSTLVLPRITLNSITRSQDVHIYIPIPAFATVDSISFAAGICTGTTSLECYMSDRAAGSSDTLDVTLRLNSTGTFTSNIQVRAANDTNAANDTGTLQIRAGAASGSSSGSSSSSSGGAASGGGGGGGRIEWTLLAALGLMAARRVRAMQKP
jgi:hypothetical protein